MILRFRGGAPLPASPLGFFFVRHVKPIGGIANDCMGERGGGEGYGVRRRAKIEC